MWEALLFYLARLVQRPVFQRVSDARGRRGVRRREIVRAEDMLQKRLAWSGGRSETGLAIRELAESFSIHAPSSDERYDARGLVQEIVGQLEDRSREGFMIASESGSGKTVLAALLPQLCRHFPELRAAALYVGHQDWEDPGLAPRVKAWISSCPSGVRKLIVFDSLDERVGENSFEKLLGEVRAHSAECGFVVLFRPLSAKYAEDISILLAPHPDRRPLELRLEFDVAAPRQCAAYCHLLPGLTPSQVSYLLRVYSDRFPDFRPTRRSAALVLRYLVDQFRGEAPSAGEPLLRPPGRVLFDEILGTEIDLRHPALELLSRVAFEILKDGGQGGTIEHLSANLRKSASELREGLQTARQKLADARSGVTVLVNREAVRIASETDVQVLAAVYIARLFATPAGDSIPRDLEELYGTARYDVCAQFILPAHQRIADHSGPLFEGVHRFLDHEDASFSFCARFIHSSQDSSLLERAEELNSKLFRKLIEAIDKDRRKTCAESIRDSRTGPNPILDQLFEVVAAYRDDVVRLLVNHVLIASHEDLEKSQAAYLILDWLKKLFGPRTTEAALLERRHRIYTVLNGLEVLQTGNLHVRFHVLEVLDFLAGQREKLKSMPEFSRRLDRLLERYGATAAEPTGNGGMRETYTRCNELVSAWALALREEEPEDRLLRTVDAPLPALLTAFRTCANDVEESYASLSAGELEQFLECYETLLGMVRRAALRSVTLESLSFMCNAAESPFWIVRWWAFYNVSHLVAGLPRSRHHTTVADCLKWMVAQVYRTSEPVGLKHRQCALLGFAVDRRPEARAPLRQILVDRGPLDKSQAEIDYAMLMADGSREIAQRSLDDYFRKVGALSR